MHLITFYIALYKILRLYEYADYAWGHIRKKTQKHVTKGINRITKTFIKIIKSNIYLFFYQNINIVI